MERICVCDFCDVTEMEESARKLGKANACIFKERKRVDCELNNNS